MIQHLSHVLGEGKRWVVWNQITSQKQTKITTQWIHFSIHPIRHVKNNGQSRGNLGYMWILFLSCYSRAIGHSRRQIHQDNISLIHFPPFPIFPSSKNRISKRKTDKGEKMPKLSRAMRCALDPIGTCLIKKTCGSTKPPISVRNHVPAGNSIHYRLPCPGTRWTHPPGLLFRCRAWTTTRQDSGEWNRKSIKNTLSLKNLSNDFLYTYSTFL